MLHRTKAFAFAGYWKCQHSHVCIALDRVCDGNIDSCTRSYPTNIHDHGDEDPEMCAKFTCSAGKFKCPDNLKCISTDMVCDKKGDCVDGSDEQNCPYCPDRFYCEGKCITDYALCEELVDCLGNGHSASCFNYTCPRGTWKCSNELNCIDVDLLCDDTQNCGDGSDEDEEFCISYTCRSTKWKCRNMKQCIDMHRVCDGYSVSGCQDKSEEDDEFCRSRNFTCPEGEWRCADGKRCVGELDVCDGFISNCIDGSDEAASVCQHFTCSANMWKCGDGQQCIHEEYLCNGFGECVDDSDEDTAMCADHSCLGDRVKCFDGKQCLRQKFLCDGDLDCNDDSDENDDFCMNYTCPAGRWKCIDGKHCLDHRYMCRQGGSRVEGCQMTELFCREVPCPGHDFKCKKDTTCRETVDGSACGNKCIWKEQVCDGETDCSDGSDEFVYNCRNMTCHQDMILCGDMRTCVKVYAVSSLCRYRGFKNVHQTPKPSP